MNRGHLVGLALALVGALGACQPAAVPPTSSSVASTSSPVASAPVATEAPSHPKAGGVIDPGWVTRPALTCGDNKRLFPPEALAGIGLAELGLDPAAAVLREFLATAPADTEFPEHGWHRVLEDQFGVTFVVAAPDPTPWLLVSVGVIDGTLQPTEYGQCNLAIAAPDGVSFGRWWLDPVAPPPSPDTTEISILVREQVCAGGMAPEGRVLPPTIVMVEQAIEVAVGIQQRPGAQDCPGNPAHPMLLVLPEPLGPRVLFDASDYPPRPVTTEDPDNAG